MTALIGALLERRAFGLALTAQIAGDTELRQSRRRRDRAPTLARLRAGLGLHRLHRTFRGRQRLILRCRLHRLLIRHDHVLHEILHALLLLLATGYRALRARLDAPAQKQQCGQQKDLLHRVHGGISVS
ncbi:hypothetical protein [Lysobacter sp. Hz 25]|uniref:hypothetical protein n=1 Tax=Lysobacter sp. Hz 25 TaxID=3383698 RepID=UPI0038D41144